jgi:hypothetical protein
MFKSLFMKKKKEIVIQQPKPIIEKVEVKEEKQQDGVRTIVSHNG